MNSIKVRGALVRRQQRPAVGCLPSLDPRRERELKELPPHLFGIRPCGAAVVLKQDRRHAKRAGDLRNLKGAHLGELCVDRIERELGVLQRQPGGKRFCRSVRCHARPSTAAWTFVERLLRQPSVFAARRPWKARQKAGAVAEEAGRVTFQHERKADGLTARLDRRQLERRGDMREVSGYE